MAFRTGLCYLELLGTCTGIGGFGIIWAGGVGIGRVCGGSGFVWGVEGLKGRMEGWKGL